MRGAMIETIVKIDGRKEDFSPNKINKWGEWASKSLGNRVDWSSVVLHTVSTLSKETTSLLLQERLIKTCLEYNSWSYNRMAGRLYAALIYKKVFNGTIPTVKEVHRNLQKIGLMEYLDYSDEEYEQVEKIIDHSYDLKATHFELKQVREKYSIRNRITSEEYESQQFVYMRMAMSLAEDQPKERRMKDLESWYYHFAEKRINAPTPNYVNLGTPLRGFASCCLYTVNDNARSIGIGDHIAYTMTYMSAGIGAHHQIRSIGDSVKGGIIKHLGKLGYYRSLVGVIKANLQNGRGGAATTYYNMFDPEVETISQLKNPMSTEDKKIRSMDYNAGGNKFFARKAAKKEDIFLFNCFTAPDLYDAFYSDDKERFERLYEKYDNDPNFKKKYVSAREVLLTVLNEGFETGRAYLHWPDEMNRHTPFKEKIFSSNLCLSGDTLVSAKINEVFYDAIPIKELVNIYKKEGSDVEVLSRNIENEIDEYKKVTNGAMMNSNAKVIRITDEHTGISIRCTPDHKIFTQRGYVLAKNLKETDELLIK